MLDTAGVATSKITRDTNGFEIERRFFDTKGQPTERHDRVHRLVITRDASGRPVEVTAFDKNGRPTVSENNGGCHRERTEYDKKGRIEAVRCLGVRGEPIKGSRDVATWTYRYDDRGCQIHMGYLGTDGKPTDDSSGVHAVGWRVNDQCQRTAHRCLNAAGKATPCGPNRAAEYQYTLDAEGNRISVRHFDADGKPSKNYAYRVFELRYTFDERGRQTGTACYDASRKPVLCSQMGYHGRVDTLDDAGREIEVRFYGPDGKAATNLGVAIRKSIYNNYDHVHEAIGLDENRKPKATRGMVKQRFVYDKGHRMFGMLLFDANGKPARYRACFSRMTCPGRPWHAIRIIRSQRGDVTQNVFFDYRKQHVGTIDCKRNPCWE
jgi:hypothetical protein